MSYNEKILTTILDDIIKKRILGNNNYNNTNYNVILDIEKDKIEQLFKDCNLYFANKTFYEVYIKWLNRNYNNLINNNDYEILKLYKNNHSIYVYVVFDNINIYTVSSNKIEYYQNLNYIECKEIQFIKNIKANKKCFCRCNTLNHVLDKILENYEINIDMEI